jgi:DNA-binding IclR family transcriptional regulator
LHRLILLALADYADDDGTGPRPTIRNLSAKARVAPGTARRAIASLERMGELRVDRTHVPHSYAVIMTTEGR